MNDQPNLETINEKLDKILTYQKNAHRWAIARGIINFLLFFILVILPIIWAYSLIRTLAGQVDFGKLAGQYNQAIKMMDQVGSVEDKLGDLNNLDAQGLLQKINGQ